MISLLLEVHPTILKDTLGSPYHLGWLFKTVSAYGISSASEAPEKPLPGVTVSVNIPQILGLGSPDSHQLQVNLKLLLTCLLHVA